MKFLSTNNKFKRDENILFDKWNNFILKSKKYHHSCYNIFLIVDPKFRIIMSENINDKIVNHFISQYLLFPTLEPKMIPMSVATRRGKGTDLGIRYIKKYIHSLKEKYDTFFF